MKKEACCPCYEQLRRGQPAVGPCCPDCARSAKLVEVTQELELELAPASRRPKAAVVPHPPRPEEGPPGAAARAQLVLAEAQAFETAATLVEAAQVPADQAGKLLRGLAEALRLELAQAWCACGGQLVPAGAELHTVDGVTHRSPGDGRGPCGGISQ